MRNNKNIKIIDREGSKFKPNCYRVSYCNNKFNIAFGEYNEVNEEIITHTDINLSIDQFKVYFNATLNAIIDYNLANNKDFMEEVMKIRKDSKGVY